MKWCAADERVVGSRKEADGSAAVSGRLRFVVHYNSTGNRLKTNAVGPTGEPTAHAQMSGQSGQQTRSREGRPQPVCEWGDT